MEQRYAIRRSNSDSASRDGGGGLHKTRRLRFSPTRLDSNVHRGTVGIFAFPKTRDRAGTLHRSYAVHVPAAAINRNLWNNGTISPGSCSRCIHDADPSAFESRQSLKDAI
jgi:hypothetical protein